MSPALFILSITLYLVSMVASLIGSFFSRFIPSRLINTIIIFHFLSLIVWLILPKPDDSLIMPVTSNYFFLTFFCTGILLAGLILKGSYKPVFKIYFTLFLLSLVFFIVSPSRLIGFISTGKTDSYNPDRIHLSENYYLVQQNETGVAPHPDSVYYKAVREMGMFHKTLLRDIALPVDYDSIQVDNSLQNEYLSVTIFKNTSFETITVPTLTTKKPNP